MSNRITSNENNEKENIQNWRVEKLLLRWLLKDVDKSGLKVIKTF